MDQAIGKVLTALDEEGVADNTIVFFFSDNGGFENYGSDNGPYRGGKLEVYEGGIRVTAVMRWRKNLQPVVKLTKSYRCWICCQHSPMQQVWTMELRKNRWC